MKTKHTADDYNLFNAWRRDIPKYDPEKAEEESKAKMIEKINAELGKMKSGELIELYYKILGI
ncbi:MAG TPA: hypothetical protein VN038_01475 [Dyadobacter sp.]|nr:hypothetical protein [Dyadobacter sp.]